MKQPRAPLPSAASQQCGLEGESACHPLQQLVLGTGFGSEVKMSLLLLFCSLSHAPEDKTAMTKAGSTCPQPLLPEPRQRGKAMQVTSVTYMGVSAGSRPGCAPMGAEHR